MDPQIKHVVRQFIPPIIFTLVRSLVLSKRTSEPEWEYVPEGWTRQETDGDVKGWNVEAIAESSVSRWYDYKQNLSGTKSLAGSSEAISAAHIDLSFHNIVMSYAYVLSLASARATDALSLLDWGGGLGHYYLLSRTLRPDISLNYSCADLPPLVREGRKLQPGITFYDDDAWKTRQFDLVVSSSSLQYIQDWESMFDDLAQSTNKYLYVTRLPTVEQHPSFVILQRPYRYGYNTEYLGWCLNKNEIIRQGEMNGLTLVREFLIENAPIVAGAPEQCRYSGFLWKRK